MRLSDLRNHKAWKSLPLVLAFFLPVVCMLMVMIIRQSYPFGTNSMLYSDMFHQYYPFFKAFRSALLSGDSLLYSWNVGMGVDYLGLVSYYVASPLNLLSVLVPEGWLLEFFSLLMPIKLGFAGLFFALFLKKMFRKNDLSLPLFACFYAMCAWALGYQWNIMWLDTFAMLPLMALGTVSLLAERKIILYTVILALSVLINYYIGFFVCIFVLLLFICYQVCRCKSFEQFCADFGRIAVCTILAIGMTAILSLPTLASLQTTQSSVNAYPDGFSVNIVSGEAVTAAKEAWQLYQDAQEAGTATFTQWWDAIKASFPPVMEGMKKIAGNIGGGLTPTFKEGLPNLYCGVGTVLFAFLFLTTKHVKLRDKICAVLMLLFFMISFLFRQLDYIWHGFHFTNMIPYRFSFLFSFVMLYMAYRAFLLRRRLQLWQLLIGGGLAAWLLFSSESVSDNIYVAYNCVFLILYFLSMVAMRLDLPLPKKVDREQLRDICYLRKQRRTVAHIVLAFTVCVEIVMNTVNFGVKFSIYSMPDYPKAQESTQQVVEFMHSQEALTREDLFYRAETTHAQTLNDGALNGYNGISTFTSSANVKITKFMQALGYAAKDTYNRYCFEEGSPVANLFLNLKYMIERDGQLEENPYFDEVYSRDKVSLLQNNAYLPLGFLAERELADVKFSSSGSTFAFQNELFSAATGLYENVWTTTPGDWLNVVGKNVTIKTQTAYGYTSYTADNSSQARIRYLYTVQEEGFLCLDITANARNTFYIYRNNEYLFTESISLPQTVAVGWVRPGDVVEVRAVCGANESSSMTIRTAMLNDTLFRQGQQLLSQSTLELTHFSNTLVEGTVECPRDGLLYTSIPQNGENWGIWVDGEEVKPELIGDVMLGVWLTEGEHTVTFRYQNPDFDLGWKVSAVCLGAFALIVLVVYKPFPNLFKKKK